MPSPRSRDRVLARACVVGAATAAARSAYSALDIAFSCRQRRLVTIYRRRREEKEEEKKKRRKPVAALRTLLQRWRTGSYHRLLLTTL